MVKPIVSNLQSIRNEEAFDLFWAYIESKRAQVDVGSPTLLCKRNVPKQYKVGKYATTAKDYYRRICFEAIDLSISSIENQFEQEGFQILQKIE